MAFSLKHPGTQKVCCHLCLTGVCVDCDMDLGRRIRVVLVAVCCDHPAMCKMCGFGDHRKEEGFCPRCHLRHRDLRTEAAMSENGLIQSVPSPLLSVTNNLSISQDVLRGMETSIGSMRASMLAKKIRRHAMISSRSTLHATMSCRV